MRAVVQRVKAASVSVDGKEVAKIGQGLCVLLGLNENDPDIDVNPAKKDPNSPDEYILRKLLTGRYFDDENGKGWARNVVQADYEILLVSQFTLFGKFKGTKLDFHVAMKTDRAREQFANFVAKTKKEYKEDKVQEGVFGAMMQVHIENDGPVTVVLDTDDK